MKAVLISGSPRAKGNTMAVLNTCGEVLKTEGIKPCLISLAGKKIQGCVACRRCKELGYCALQDDFNPILQEIKEAQGLIVGAPVYFGTARGDMMNLLQRLGMVSLSKEKFLKHMVGGPVVVGRRGGHTASIQEMLMVFFINGMTVPGGNYWNMLFGGAAGEVMQDEEGLENARAFTENVARLIKLEAAAAK